MSFLIKKVFIGIGVVLVIFFCIIGYFVVKDFQQEDILKQEVIKLSNKDLVNDSFNISIKTKGDYVYVENAIKKYYKDLSDAIKELYSALDSQFFSYSLTVENLESDRPHFLDSKNSIDTITSRMNHSFDRIVALLDKEYIKNLVSSDKVDSYYVNFYQKLMYTEQDLEYFNDIRERMKQFAGDLNLFMEQYRKIFDMLEKNNSEWYIDGGQIYFSSNELVNEYNQLYTELKNIRDSKLSKYQSFDDEVSDSSV